MSEKNQKMRIVDDPSVAEAYANKVVGVVFDGGACTITLGCQRFLTERVDERPKEGQHPKVYVTQRLSVSPAAAVELVNQLNVFLSHFSQIQQAQEEVSKNTSH